MEMENSSCKLSKNTKQRASLFGHVAQLNPDVPPHQPLWMQADLSNGQKLNVRCQDGPLVDHERPGATRSGLTSECLLITTTTPVSTMATWNGSQGLRDDADDDHDRNTIYNSS